MPFDSSAGQLVLLRALKRQREHVLGAVDGLGQTIFDGTFFVRAGAASAWSTTSRSMLNASGSKRS